MRNNVGFEFLWLGTLPRLLLSEGFALTENPAGEARVTWMRDWTIPSKVVGQGPWSPWICLEFFSGMFLLTRSDLRYKHRIHNFIYSRIDMAD